MNTSDLFKLKYPIGEFQKPNTIEKQQIDEWILAIESFPEDLITITKQLNQDQLNYTYRPNGWTIKQVIHHCADSHMNSINRFKLALTEDTPTIRPYFEDRFANLIDYSEPIDSALSIINGVHKKLGILLKNLNSEDLKRQYKHPEHGKHFSIEETIGVYAWHSNHHLAHIKQALHYKSEFN